MVAVGVELMVVLVSPVVGVFIDSVVVLSSVVFGFDSEVNVVVEVVLVFTMV